MRYPTLLFLCAVAGLPSCVSPEVRSAGDDRYKDVKLVCDHKYAIDNLAFTFGAKFSTQEGMLKYINLTQPITGSDGKTLKLADILVELDLNGNGDVASWLVSGPAPTVSTYKALMDAAARDEDVIYDYSVTPANCKPTAFFEAEEQ